MNDLQIIENGLVPVYTTDTGERVVNGRELWVALGSKSDFSHWVRARLNDCDAKENTDFVRDEKFIASESHSNLRNKTIDYIIQLPIAKEMAMLERNERGKQVRKYFIAVEEKYRQSLTPSGTSTAIQADLLPIDAIKAMLTYVEKHEYKLNDHDERIKSLEQYQAVKAEAITYEKAEVNVPTFFVKHDLYTSTAIGHAFGLSARVVNSVLLERGIQEPISDSANSYWVLLRKFRHMDYAMQAPRRIEINGKQQYVRVALGWTQTGADFICELLKGLGYEQIRQLSNRVLARKQHARKKASN